MIRRLALPVFLGACTVLAGCVGEDRVAYVQAAPPPEAAEIVAVSPGPEYLSVRGHWEWDGSHYVWKHSRYLRRPHARAVWVEAHWQNTDRGWYWQEGHWAEVNARKVKVPRSYAVPVPPGAPPEVPEGIEEEGAPAAQAGPPAGVPAAPAYVPPPPPANRPPPPGAVVPQRYAVPTPGAEY